MTRNTIYIPGTGGKAVDYKQNQYMVTILKVVTKRESNKF